MDFKRFSIQVVVRVLIILGITISISYFFFKQDRFQLVFTFFVLISLLIIAVTELIWFVNKTNREVSKFIMSIKYSDFSVYFPEENKKGYLADLYASFNSIIDSFKKLSGEKHLQYELLQLIISQVKLGIMVTNGKNEVVLMNAEAEKLLGVFKTKTWSQLSHKAALFTSKADDLKRGGNNIIDFAKTNEKNQLFLQVKHCRLFDEPHRIISFHDIRKEVEQKETEAWIRLIRILNHEIMNSVTPISSLSETILMILNQDSKDILKQEQIEDIKNSVETIKNRSEGLYNFVTEYRKLTKIPSPKKEDVSVIELIDNVIQLWRPQLEQSKIDLNISINPNDLIIQADPNLIEQVLINLIKNAIQALEQTEDTALKIISYKLDETTHIEIKDNGSGIPSKIINDVFVPFYTTKEKGSGIGLSLSRQIMRLHDGNITIQSKENEGTTITLSF